MRGILRIITPLKRKITDGVIDKNAALIFLLFQGTIQENR